MYIKQSVLAVKAGLCNLNLYGEQNDEMELQTTKSF